MSWDSSGYPRFNSKGQPTRKEQQGATIDLLNHKSLVVIPSIELPESDRTPIIAAKEEGSFLSREATLDEVTEIKNKKLAKKRPVKETVEKIAKQVKSVFIPEE